MTTQDSNPVASPRPISRLIRPFQEFARMQAASGVLLLTCTALALMWANSPWQASYTQFLNTTITVGADGFSIQETLLHWINDFLMTVFFLVVGLEIKREVLIGELSSLRKAALPVSAAIGGMLIPALLFLSVNSGSRGAAAWGVPMATDIAFALGVLALLGRRVPSGLKIFLAAFAIADDIGAVLVIALFYTASIHAGALVFGIVLFGLAALANWSGIRTPLVYALLGLVMWIAFLKSGIHATVVGILLALTIPARARIEPATFVEQVHPIIEEFERTGDRPADDVTVEAERQAALHTLEHATERVQTPLQRMEHALHPWVTFFIMPAFALANAGVTFSGAGQGILGPVPLGIFLGLVVGKPLGVTLFAWVAVRTRLAALPDEVTWRHVHGASWLGGIGFTMALFIAGLAIPEPTTLVTAKLGILCASLTAGVVGYLILFGSTVGGMADREATDGLDKRS